LPNNNPSLTKDCTRNANSIVIEPEIIVLENLNFSNDISLDDNTFSKEIDEMMAKVARNYELFEERLEDLEYDWSLTRTTTSQSATLNSEYRRYFSVDEIRPKKNKLNTW